MLWKWEGENLFSPEFCHRSYLTFYFTPFNDTQVDNMVDNFLHRDLFNDEFYHFSNLNLWSSRIIRTREEESAEDEHHHSGQCNMHQVDTLNLIIIDESYERDQINVPPLSIKIVWPFPPSLIRWPDTKQDQSRMQQNWFKTKIWASFFLEHYHYESLVAAGTL